MTGDARSVALRQVLHKRLYIPLNLLTFTVQHHVDRLTLGAVVDDNNAGRVLEFRRILELAQTLETVRAGDDVEAPHAHGLSGTKPIKPLIGGKDERSVFVESFRLGRITLGLDVELAVIAGDVVPAWFVGVNDGHAIRIVLFSGCAAFHPHKYGAEAGLAGYRGIFGD